MPCNESDRYNDEEITVIIVEKYANSGVRNYRFTFKWSNRHWKENYKELAFIPNVYFYPLYIWEPLMKIVKGLDPVNYALLYLNDDNEHIRFIAKLILLYGETSVRFEQGENS